MERQNAAMHKSNLCNQSVRSWNEILMQNVSHMLREVSSM